MGARHVRFSFMGQFFFFADFDNGYRKTNSSEDGGLESTRHQKWDSCLLAENNPIFSLAKGTL